MDYLESFHNYLLYERRVSEHTLKSYLTDLNQFGEFITSCQKVFPREVQSVDVRNWLSDLMISGKSPASVNRKMSSLRSFFKFLALRHAYPKDPAQYIKGLKKSKKSPLALKESELCRLFESFPANFNENFSSFRDYLILELLYSLGLRRSELTELREENVDLNRFVLRVKGKGNKTRELPLRIELVNLLKTYIEVKKENFGPDNLPFLILTDKGGKAYDKMIYLNVKRNLTENMVTLDRKSPHVLRHSFATHLTDRGAALSAVRDLLGHSSLASTQVYLHNSTRKLKEVHKNCFPRG